MSSDALGAPSTLQSDAPAAAGPDPLAAINAIRGLSMDAVEAANSGHPGLPLAMAPAAYLLYARIMVHDPEDPSWPDRDRFVLSAGHGSALLYSVLHLCGYDLPMEELKRFRQWGSATPGHPERESNAPIETTTGPLGQGFANAVGMAMAERFLRERYGDERMDHHIYGICSDGDLMEGVSAEAASLAGHLGLGRLNFLYDDNRITIDGSTELSFDTEDVEARFRAYGWHTSSVDDANDVDALEHAILAAKAETDRPSLIRVRSVIGWPAPTKSGTAGAHGSPLGADEVRETKRLLGLDPEATFAVSEAARAAFDDARRIGRDAHQAWADRLADWRSTNPDAGAEWDSAWAGKPTGDIAACLPHFDDEKMATRSAGGKVMQAFADLVPTMVGGSADLVGSTKTEFAGEQSFTRTAAGRNVHWGIREHAMGASVNGMAAHGGIVKPFGSTFLVFSDYMRPSIRLSAVMGLPVVWVFTHDSIGVGEDGPTHQPVEILAALRAIPGFTTIRPGDANETAQAWKVAIEHRHGPVLLALTRQKVPTFDQETLGRAEGVRFGGYILADSKKPVPDAILIGTGSEVQLALKAKDILGGEGIDARVVSFPSWELFEAQPAAYRETVLPAAVKARVAVEAGISMGWSKYVGDAGAFVGIDHYGASAP
ncbi:MAG: transketolase, partial [Solirubrobacterales bacterium]